MTGESVVSVDHLQRLGESQTNYQFNYPDPTVLEKFENPFSLEELNSCKAFPIVEIETSEFSSLCPKTGQPDWATMIVRYRPRKWCVESKSYKLYLGGFRQHGEFHEACVARICNDLVKLLDPEYLVVIGQFTPRGGIKFWPTAEYFRPLDPVNQDNA
jgi:7-cyano-7-deazaguanine reductase